MDQNEIVKAATAIGFAMGVLAGLGERIDDPALQAIIGKAYDGLGSIKLVREDNFIKELSDV